MTQYSLVETVCFFGTLVATYHSTLRHSPLDDDLNVHNCKGLKLCITAAEQHLEKKLLPITPTLHDYIITATTTITHTTPATAMNTTSAATAVPTSLLHTCGTVVVT